MGSSTRLEINGEVDASLLCCLYDVILMRRYKIDSCSLLLYGHTARVWDGQLLDNCVISIGEDATCRVWGYDGKCMRVMDGHRGRNIWSMAVDETTGLVVGYHLLTYV